MYDIIILILIIIIIIITSYCDCLYEKFSNFVLLVRLTFL